MTDKKISELTLTTSVLDEDVFPVVVNPSTIPETKKVTVSGLFSGKGLLDNTAWSAKGDLVVGSGDNNSAIFPTSATNSQKLITDSSQSLGLKWIDDDLGFSVILGDGLNTLTTGVKGYLEIPVSFTIESWTIVADASGSCVIDIWKDVAASFPPTDADSITAAATPTLSNAQMATSSTLTGWTTSCLKSEWLAFNVDSATTCKQVTLAIKGKRTATS